MLEHLDMRIAPTAMATAAALSAELRVEARHVARADAALARAAPGGRDQQLLLNHVAQTEQRMGAQEVRLARIEARMQPRIQSSPMFRVKGQPPTKNPPSPVIQPYVVATHTAPSNVLLRMPPSASGSSTSLPPSASSSSTSLPPSVSAVLDVIAYTSNPSDFPANVPATGGANRVVIQGTNVGIQVHDNNPSDFNNLVSALEAAGMQITSSSSTNGLVVGMLPCTQLPTVAGLSEVQSITALYRPTLN
jgi:hypothetical protein